MTYRRTSVQDFSIANALYAGAQVYFYEVDGSFVITSTLATLYEGISGSNTLLNPQTLDSLGKFQQPVYIEDPVIMEVTGLASIPTHVTGVVFPSLSDADALAAAAAAVLARRAVAQAQAAAASAHAPLSQNVDLLTQQSRS